MYIPNTCNMQKFTTFITAQNFYTGLHSMVNVKLKSIKWMEMHVSHNTDHKTGLLKKYNPSTFYLRQTVKFKICTVQYVIVNISLAL